VGGKEAAHPVSNLVADALKQGDSLLLAPSGFGGIVE
jgi:hypothetical protein